MKSAAAQQKKPAVFSSVSCDLPVKHLYVDESYQRPLGTRHAPIVAAFDEHRFETIAVNERAERRGRFAVIDGYARLAAARELQLLEVPARCYDRLTVEQEADLFVKLQEGRKNLRPYDRFRAKERAGYADTIEIHGVVVQAGLELGPEWKPGIVGAVRALEGIYRTHGAGILARVLKVTTTAWGVSEHGGMSAGMLQGLARVLPVSLMDDTHIASKLRRKLPSDVFRAAGGLAAGRVQVTSDAKHVALAIVALCGIALARPLDEFAADRSAARGEKREGRGGSKPRGKK